MSDLGHGSSVFSLDSITLRKFSSNDSAMLQQLCNNKKIADKVRDIFPHPYSLEDAEFFIGLCETEDPQVTFAIEYEGHLAGAVGLVPQKDIYRKSAEIGYWIGEPFWGKGIATQAAKLVVDYGFTKLGLLRIFSGVFENNPGSCRVLEKAGFTRDAVFKSAVVKNGVIMDEIRYSIVK